jgi:SAM-dependent methyltransferase
VDPFSSRLVAAAYGVAAKDYAEAFAADLDQLPLDRSVLERAARAAEGGMILDLGCGVGQVADYLGGRGARVVGFDLAGEMLGVGRQRQPALALAAADMRVLPVRSGSCAGAVAMYSVQHIARGALGEFFAEVRRVLTRGGRFVIATHLGEGEVYAEEFLGHPIDRVGFNLYRAEELEAALTSAAFEIESRQERGPLAHESQTQRVYLVARRG